MIVGILLLYFVGKAFYDLAHEHDRSRWGFAILGVVSYYVGSIIIGGIILFVIFDLFFSRSLEDVNDFLLSLLAMPFGVLTCWGLYKILQNAWAKSTLHASSESGEVLDADLLNNKEQ